MTGPFGDSHSSALIKETPGQNNLEAMIDAVDRDLAAGVHFCLAGCREVRLLSELKSETCVARRVGWREEAVWNSGRVAQDLRMEEHTGRRVQGASMM